MARRISRESLFLHPLRSPKRTIVGQPQLHDHECCDVLCKLFCCWKRMAHDGLMPVSKLFDDHHNVQSFVAIQCFVSRLRQVFNLKSISQIDMQRWFAHLAPALLCLVCIERPESGRPRSQNSSFQSNSRRLI